MIAIIDYDAGNLKSVEKALLYLGEECVVTRDRNELLIVFFCKFNGFLMCPVCN